MPTTDAEGGAGSRAGPGPPVLVVLTGESGAGKTTLCVGAADYAKSRGLSVGGLLSLPHPAGDGNEWRRVTDIGSGEWQVLGRLRPPGCDSLAPSQCENRDGSGQAVSSVADHTPLAWEFYADAFPWANARLARYADEPPDVLIVDEVGRLELTRGGGWGSAVPLLAAGGYRLGITVVRPQLLTVFAARVGSVVSSQIVEVRGNAAARAAARGAIYRLIEQL